MILRYLGVVMCSLMLLLFTSCGDSDESPGTSTNATATAVTTINGKLKAVSDMLGGSSSSFSQSLESDGVSLRASGINSVWTTDPGVNPLSNSGTSSLQLWFTQQFDETFENSNGARVTFAGRIANALDVLCYMANAGLSMESSTNLPAVGTHSVTITAAVNTACGGGASDAVGSSIPLTVTATTDTTYYDRLLSFQLPGSESCPFKFYARMNSTAINIADAEDQSCDGRDHASKSIVHHDVSSRVTRFHYFSKAFGNYPSGYEVYRGYLNEATDEAYIVGFYGGDNDGDTTFESGVSFTAVGKPVAGGTVAVSAKSINNTIGDDEYQGCIEPSAMTVSNDNTLSCTMTGTDSAVTHASVVQDLFDDYANRAAVYNIGETETVGFTDQTDIFN